MTLIYQLIYSFLFNYQNSTLTCLPYLIGAITNTLLGKVLDWGRLKGLYSQTGARKIAVGISELLFCSVVARALYLLYSRANSLSSLISRIGCLPVIGFLVAIMLIGCNQTVSVILLVLSIITSAAIFLGHLTNQNDLAPNYAGILMGITNTPGTISAFALPTLVGVMVKDGVRFLFFLYFIAQSEFNLPNVWISFCLQHTFAAWNKVFGLNICCQLLAFLIFTFFGSAKIQDWNYPDGVVPATR